MLVLTAVCVACAWLLTPVSGFLEDQILQVWLQVKHAYSRDLFDNLNYRDLR